MSKKKKKVQCKFDLGFLGLTPSTQPDYVWDKTAKVPVVERKKLSKLNKEFQEFLADMARDRIKDLNLEEIYPTDEPIYIYIVQHFVSEKKYKSRDLDNIARTILNSFGGVVYKSDVQVKTLLVAKRLKDKKIKDNFLYIVVEKQKIGTDVSVVRWAGIQSAYEHYIKLKKSL